jgi:hypothetical protein
MIGMVTRVMRLTVIRGLVLLLRVRNTGLTPQQQMFSALP